MKKKEINYIVRFVNESRTTTKYKISKDVANAIKKIEKVCNNLSSEKNKTTLLNIGREFRKRAAVLYDNNFSSIPLCHTDVMVNQEKYNLNVMLNYSDSLSVRATANKKTKIISIVIYCPSMDELVEIIDNKLLFRFIKEDLNHEFAHIYDEEKMPNNHYSQFNNIGQSPVHLMYYLTSPDEIKSFCQEVFYIQKNENHDKSGIEILNSIIYGYIGDELLTNLTLRLIISQIKNSKPIFNRYYSLFSPNTLKLFSKESVEKIRKILLNSIQNDTWQELLSNEKFLNL